MKEVYRITFLDGQIVDKILNQEERALIIRNANKPVLTCLPLCRKSSPASMRVLAGRRHA